MSNVIKNSVTLFVLLLTFLGTAHFVLASEVTGSLSSDGSTDTEQEAVLGETSASSNETTGQVVAQNSGQLQGSVVQGRDEGTGMSATDASSWNTAMWVIPLAGAALVAFAFFLWRRKVS